MALGLAAVGLALALLLVAAARRGRPVHVGGAGVVTALALMLVYQLVFEPREPPFKPDVPAVVQPVDPSAEPAR